ncbi:MAG: hypothetical protein WA790_14105 [Sulfitobacter sp.]
MTLKGLKSLTVVTLAYFVGLAIFARFWLGAADLGTFDAQIFGYGLGDAQTYISGLSNGQIALYRGPFRIADTIFPALLALTLLLWFRRWTVGSARLSLTLVTALYLAADYTENMLVGRLLVAGADGLTMKDVDTASLFTMGKWGVLIVCLAAFLMLWWQNRARQDR